MHEILGQHINQGEMSKKILRLAYRNYFDEFDPNKIYLIKKEVVPFLDMPDAQLDIYIEQYKKGDYSIFDKMHEVVVIAIKRARGNIPVILAEKNSLFDAAKKRYENGDIDSVFNADYAKDVQELLARQKTNAVNFLVNEMSRFHSEDIIKQKDRFLKIYESSLDEHEERYLALDEGNPMSPQKREHTKTLLILKALSSSLDSHTHFFDDNEAFEMRSRLDKSYVGLGIAFEEKSEGIFVSNITVKSPAGRMGSIHLGDRLLAIDGHSIVDETYAKAMKLLEKPEGNTSILRFDRQGKHYDVNLKYEMITSEDDRVGIHYEHYKHGIVGFLTLNSFYQGRDDITSEHDLDNAIKKLKEKGPLLGLILDLRENGGGYLAQAVKVAGLFITNGVVVISKYGNGETNFYRDMNADDDFDGPLIILTSRLTASAAEIVAQSLQDYGVALVVGDDRTYGKGSIQTQTVTENGADPNFKVTVGEYYTVSGKTPQNDGVAADVVVPGEYMHEAIGEKYSDEALQTDHIAPAFNDGLSDVPVDKKTWYLKYYMPTLQKKENHWRQMIPELKKRSAERITRNKDYSNYLQAYSNNPGGAKKGPSPTNIDIYELQSQEARNVLHDMIDLESQYKTGDK